MAKQKKEPFAFLSYVRDDDKHDNGRISEIRERLAAEVKMQTGREFHIFQDRNDIGWGQNWAATIDGSIEAVTFFIPIITPSFFNSPACCEELEKFVVHQKKMKRTDLILPIYYVASDLLDKKAKRETSKIAQILSKHQHRDWRELRFNPLSDPMINSAIAEMATQIKDAMERIIYNNGKTKITTKESKSSPKKQATINEINKVIDSTIPKSEKNPTQKTEIKRITVDAMHRGHFATISEAIRHAEPGTIILIKPGLYSESIKIEKPLEIIGDGERDQIVIQSKDNFPIKFISSMGRISNLTIRQLGGKFFAIDIAQGRLDIEDCDITSSGLAAIGIHNWADPRIRRNIIRDSNAPGIFVYDNGQGTIEDNDIFNNNCAISIVNSNPQIRKNRIRDSRECGILIEENGKGLIEDNDIFNNTYSGIQIRTEGNPIVRKNRIRYGKQGGFLIYQNGKGIIEDNIISNNNSSGIEVREAGAPYVSKNIINHNIYEAIWVNKGGGGIYENNDLTLNKRGPWDISPDSKDLVTRKGNIEK